ncbi:desmoglein-2-like [Protopterus annectens]|uniref:desmoglein-2-like n=1 Tax=Protopterus annectens TaxID=7888 RepID=UPI001CFB10AE|nr:desmoglein-2-like [Protopterus annectens]
MGNPGKEIVSLVLLVMELTALSKIDAWIFSEEVYSRHKREWIVPPLVIQENKDYSSQNPIAKIRSDNEHMNIMYNITGPGVGEYFSVNERDGGLNILKIVDREQYAEFSLKGHATDQHGNNLENPILIRIRISDVNDNGPQFTKKHFFAQVEELCNTSTLITMLNATDADAPNTLNSKLAYHITEQQPSGTQMFKIARSSGEVFPTNSNLDREAQATYNLTVEVKDLDGGQFAFRDVAVLTISLLDVNDNIPYLEKPSYEGSIEENKANVEVMRIKAYDKDEEFTDNWFVNFMIVSGNEDGYFKIVTDTKTNEGVLILLKGVNYEQLQHLTLGIVYSNKATYHHSLGIVSSRKPIPIKVNIINVPEGAMFRPSRKIVSVSEDKKVITLNKVVTTYAAIEEDTGLTAKNVIYAKDLDADNWISIDPTTADIKFIKYPDRESVHIVNGTYTVKIIAISEDKPPKTSTGTITFQVEDSNDNCPQVSTTPQTFCEEAPYINVTATDLDDDPNAGPFSFKIVDEPVGTTEIWKVGETYGTSMQLVRQKPLWPKEYEVQFQISDRQGLMCTEKQILKLHVCSCHVDGIHCADYRRESSAVLGGGAIGLMILAFLLLLLVPLLLLVCKCGGAAGPAFALIPDAITETLQPWNKEGAAPQDKVPISFAAGSFSEKSMQASGMSSGAHMSASGIAAGAQMHGLGIAAGAHMTSSVVGMQVGRAAYGTDGAIFADGYRAGSRELLEISKSMGYAGMYAAGGAVNESFLLKYYMEQSCQVSEEDARKAANDCVMIYQNEGIGSPAGSVGCCSFIESDLEDDFLDDLGPKFKQLAEVCTGLEIRKEMTFSQFISTGESSTAGQQQAVRQSGSALGSFSQSTAKATNHFESSLHSSAPPIQPAVSQSQSTLHSTSISTSQVVSHSQSAESSSETVVQNVGLANPSVQVGHFTPESVVKQNVVVLDGLHASGSNLQVVGTTPEAAIQQHVLVTEHSIAPGTFLRPVGVVAEPVVLQQHYVLAETSHAAGSPAQSILQPVSNVGGAHNVILMEGSVVSAPGAHGYLVSVEPEGHQQVLVREETVAPNVAVKSSISKVTKYSTLQFSEA